MKNKITDLRNNLFQGMEMFLDPDSGFTPDHAHALASMGKVIVESAKVEVMAAKLVGGDKIGSDFIPYDQRTLTIRTIDDRDSQEAQHQENR